MFRFTFRSAAVFLALAVSATSFAQGIWFNPKTGLGRERRKSPDTLIVTSNYAKSRLLAELIQFRSNLPVLLLPTEREQNRLYALSPKGDAVVIDRRDYRAFVNFLNPTHVIFLGDENYVPEHLIEEVRSDKWAFTICPQTDWTQIAALVGKQLDLRKLERQFETKLAELERGRRMVPDLVQKPAGEAETPWSEASNR